MQSFLLLREFAWLNEVHLKTFDIQLVEDDSHIFKADLKYLQHLSDFMLLLKIGSS